MGNVIFNVRRKSTVYHTQTQHPFSEKIGPHHTQTQHFKSLTQHYVPHITVKLNNIFFWLEKTLNLFHQINFMKVQVKREKKLSFFNFSAVLAVSNFCTAIRLPMTEGGH